VATKSALTLLSTVLIGCTQLPLMQCHGADGSKMHALRFPEQVAKRELRGAEDEAERLFTDAKQQLAFRTGEVVITGDRLRLAALVTNAGVKMFPLVVYPSGGRFPYGGDNPSSLRFADESGAVVMYSGERYPPEPPLPLLIEIPGASCVQFEAEIDLQNYTYRGSPRVLLEWSFSYFKGDYPKGRKQVRLPAR
jgi:hypothetical protein